MPRIVIDIDENMYQKIKGMEMLINRAYKSLELAVLEGTVLPEDCGRLVDADALEEEITIGEGIAEGACDYYMSDVLDRAKEYIIDAETIIPATKEGE